MSDLETKNQQILDDIEAKGFENLETLSGETFQVSVMDNWQKKVILITDKATGEITVFVENEDAL